jgi:hypothetical protein
VLGMPKVVVGYSGGYTSSASETECVFGAWWNATKIHINKKRSGFWWDAGKRGWKEGLDDMDMRARRVILDRLEWSGTPGGRFTG